MRHTSVVLVILAIVALGAGRGRSQPEPPAKSYIVPFDVLPSNHMAVQAKVNGKGPYWLIFDVGAPFTVLTNKASKEAGVIKPNARGSFLLGATGPADVRSLTMGGAEIKNLPVMVMDHPAVRALGSFFRPLHGIIGHTVFARFRTTIDYQAKTLTLEPIDNKVENFLEDFQERMMGGGPARAKEQVLSPSGLWGLTLDDPGGGVASRGVPLAALVTDGPAAKAGMAVGDLIATVDGRWTASVADVFEAAAKAEPGKPIEVELIRGGESKTVTVLPRPGF